MIKRLSHGGLPLRLFSRSKRGSAALASSILILLIFLPGVLAPVTQASSVVFGIQPSTLQFNPGESFNITVNIISGGSGVYSAYFMINYNTSFFGISSLSPSDSWRVDQVNSTYFSISRPAVTGGFPDSGPIVTLTFSPRSNGAVSSSLVSLSSAGIFEATGGARVGVISSSSGITTVSTRAGSSLPPWWPVIPIAILLAVIPPIVYLARRKPPQKKQPPQQPFTMSVLRKEDLLSLQFDFHNFKLEKSAPPAKLVKVNPAEPGYMSVTFQGQNIAERAFFEESANVSPPANDPDKSTGNSDQPTLPPVPAIIAGPSRLVFTIPPSVLAMTYSLGELLNWAKYEMSVAPTAQELLFMRPQIRKPEATETSIESPYRLIISPNQLEGWANSPELVTHGGWTELWHTRLGMRKQGTASQWVIDETDSSGRTVRAIWSPDYSATSPPDTNLKGPFRMPLTPRDRYEIVRLTSDFSHAPPPKILQKTPAALPSQEAGLEQVQKAPLGKGQPPTEAMDSLQVSPIAEAPSSIDTDHTVAMSFARQATYVPSPVQVNRLMLSTLGSWMDVRGAWEPPTGLSVQEWVHRSTMARDHYVKVVYKGYLFPLGHRASLVKVTERKFKRTAVAAPPRLGAELVSLNLGQDEPFVAYLRQRMYIVVLEHEKSYSGDGRNNSGRDWPFGSVNIITKVTPDIDDPSLSGVGQLGIKAFWPRVGNQDFMFHMQVKDSEGQQSEFTAPLIFIMNEIATDRSSLDTVYKAYPKEEKRRACDMAGQRVAYALSTKPGDTTLETTTLHLGHEDPAADPPQGQPFFYPTVAQFDVDIPSLNAILGSGASIQLKYDEDTFLPSGFDGQKNAGEVFAGIVPNTNLKLNFPADKVGGLANPNMSIVGLSRMLGPIGGDLGSIKQGSFDPTQYFKDALNEAKILGISLLNVIDKASLDQVPRFVMETLGSEQQGSAPKQVKTTMTWNPTLKNDPTNTFVAHIDRDGGTSETASMSLSATIVKNQDNSPPAVDVVGYLKNFEIHLIPATEEFLVIRFDMVSFESHSGQKMTFGAKVNGVKFAGDLAFVNSLQSYIPGNGFDGASLTVTPTGVQAGFDLGIPSVGFGVFSLQNINLSASISLPFTGDPLRVRFAFCERQRPFLLSVAIFGGGGFLAMTLGPDKVELIEGSLEFGGNISIDIGVASGGVYVMAGIYFALQDVPNVGEKCQLSGYLRCGGSLDVLGIVSVSVEFYMSLNYEDSPSRVWGEASLTVEVSVAFFSESVSLTVQRTFAGSPPPSFEDLVPRLQDWSDYCDAFG